MWNHEPWRVIVPYYGFNNLHTVRIRRVGYLETDVLMGGKFHPKLNKGERPIANKYCEGKMKRTLKRESKSAWNCWEGTVGNQCEPWSSSGGPLGPPPCGLRRPSLFMFRRKPSDLSGRGSGGCEGLVNGSLHPVLKHGPRSLTHVRVRWWQTTVRNESDDRMLRGCTIDRPLGYGLEVWVGAFVSGPERWWTMPE